ncbi:hypothetical protein [Clostridium amazonitimonense]|uniref:hypothetical protein n=1 Tax=Clostridium amazonitimonense TaxID=1499689 RepID=UPI000A49E3B8|nr:hypothetical protein [Clostridium amazonitimonense]
MRNKEYSLIQKIGLGILIPAAFVFFTILGDTVAFKDLVMEIYGVKQPVKNKR